MKFIIKTALLFALYISVFLLLTTSCAAMQKAKIEREKQLRRQLVTDMLDDIDTDEALTEDTGG